MLWKMLRNLYFHNVNYLLFFRIDFRFPDKTTIRVISKSICIRIDFPSIDLLFEWSTTLRKESVINISSEESYIKLIAITVKNLPTNICLECSI